MKSVKSKFADYPASRLFLCEKLVLNAIGQGLPGRFHDIFRHADGAPLVLMVSGFDQDTNLGLGPFIRSQHTHFIVEKLDFPELRIEFFQ